MPDAQTVEIPVADIHLVVESGTTEPVLGRLDGVQLLVLLRHRH
jgi:hypothetical protein